MQSPAIMNPPPRPHENPVDADHLNLLSVFHYVMAGTALLGLLFVLAHYLVMVNVVPQMGGMPGVPGSSWIGGFYLLIVLLIIAAAAANFFSGRWIKQRKNRVFSLVVAGFNCLQIPLGLALGIFTFIVLMRPSVQQAYAFAPENP